MLLTAHPHRSQLDTLTQNLEHEVQAHGGEVTSDNSHSQSHRLTSPSPESIRGSLLHYRTSVSRTRSTPTRSRRPQNTPAPLSLRHRIRTHNSFPAGRTISSISNGNSPAALVPYPFIGIETSSSSTFIMSRPTPSSARPTHIPMPPNNMTGFSPSGTPLATPPIGGAAASPASPRHSFLGFMRTRGRSNTLNNVNQTQQPPLSPSLERTAPESRNTSREGSQAPTSREPLTVGGIVTRSISTPLSGGGLNISTGIPTPNGVSAIPETTSSTSARSTLPSQPPAADVTTTRNAVASSTSSRTYRIRLVPNLESTRSLAFDPVIREMLPIVVPAGVSPSVAAQSVSSVGPSVNGRPPALLLKVGRFTDKSNLPAPGNSANGTSNTAGSGATMGPNSSSRNGGSASLTIAGGGGDMTSSKVAFKSKVVSRSHAEIWCEEGGKFFIRDTSSSSGTFLNHIRLSSPNTVSRPTMINDGDVLQLGVDYQGGAEEMFRCVKMRVEIGREWQRGANEFNTNALKQLKVYGGSATADQKKTEGAPSKKARASVTDCCICLFSVTVCQSLFIAPCSHVFHYKCIRPLLDKHYPGFSCPLCRTFANLEEDVETEDAWEIASRRASIISRKPSNHSIRLPSSTADAGPSSSPSAPNGQPSTNIGLGGANSASVTDLLNPGETETGESEETEGMIGSSALARQATAVAPGHSDVEMEVPEIVQEESELDETAHEGVPITNGRNGENDIGVLDAQTPMNEHFLSTLAIGDNAGIAQRFDLADEIVGNGTPTTASAIGSNNNSHSGSTRASQEEGRNAMYT
ncbi:uncharacterized protein I206_105297 [Kwoniella pini CBS 10737]|uniref:Cytoplasmic protein n=1 Tax=Kwoniella pini CBS 10737 TaxID=1296096 RepID=A0A1B9I4M6_9TREE|nr:uncharacterized protein I206_03794 [Kwoniella pini CBS 10737]OCF50470.1 hypothetical protein I206_03794 [Kwoniella pini CBS 10737]